MHKRIFALATILLVVGMVTHAFAQAPVDTTPVTRAGAVALLVEADPLLKARLQHFIKHTPPMPLFEDVDYIQWYAPYIETAFEAGLITGNASARFRPGAYMTDEEGITLAARYRSITNPQMLGEMQSATHQNWFDGVLAASAQGGLVLPTPVRLGQPMRKADFFALMVSMNIQNPQQLAISHNPNPAPPVVAQAPAPARPTTTPISQIINRPPVQQAVRPVVQQPVVTTPAPSAKPFSISMPTLGVKDLTITHPTDPFTKEGLHAPLQYGVGHLFSYPGKGGKILVYGHSSSYAWDVSDYTKIFRQINKLNVGDKIYVTYAGKVHTYQVTHKQTVPAADFSAYQGGNSEELILYTCWPPDSIKERYLVHAKPIETVAQR